MDAFLRRVIAQREAEQTRNYRPTKREVEKTPEGVVLTVMCVNCGAEFPRLHRGGRPSTTCSPECRYERRKGVK